MSSLIRRTWAVLFFLLLSVGSAWADSQGLLSGTGQFSLTVPTLNGPQPLTVFFYRPLQARPDTPVVVVMHGVNRNAADYRDQWIEPAREHGFIVLAPEFTKTDFPGSAAYNLGNLMDADEHLNPKETWSFTLVHRVFQRAIELTGGACQRFGLFGHSAGGQFVHRMVSLYPRPEIGTAVAANAGWYTLPLRTVRWPYGWQGLPEGRVGDPAFDLKAAFAKHLVLLLGEEDTDPEAENLRNTKETKAQGPHRLARGQYFLAESRKIAARLGLPFAWEMVLVPGVDHSPSRMAKAAAEIFAAHPSC
ncbi:MAG: hypothetical protein A2516_00110 [Alphaproteobacteria bacterium RIFOXYD12_FULL_60_8]|nr:MAG: hypothetical protein A2516_00110 [Alphaproteobacteria bacterium RIFOXYD12_FULL_60_8]